MKYCIRHRFVRHKRAYEIIELKRLLSAPGLDGFSKIYSLRTKHGGMDLGTSYRVESSQDESLGMAVVAVLDIYAIRTAITSEGHDIRIFVPCLIRALNRYR
jgi:hypothetical protein